MIPFLIWGFGYCLIFAAAVSNMAATPEEGFAHFISNKMDDFAGWILENGLDPTPPDSEEYQLNMRSGLINLDGSLSGISITGLSTLSGIFTYGTSFANLQIGISATLYQGGISGRYNATGMAVGSHFIGGDSTWRMNSDFIYLDYYTHCHYSQGRIVLNSSISVNSSEFRFNPTNLSGGFDNLYDQSPEISEENRKYIFTHMATVLPDMMFKSRDIFGSYFTTYLQEAFSGTPVTDIIDWAPAAPMTTGPTRITTTDRSSTDLGGSEPTSSSATPPPHKVYTECELATELSYLKGDTGSWDEHLEHWVCLSDVTTMFNGSYLHISDADPTLVYYGIFKISNRWCTDEHHNIQDNPCGMQCEDLRNSLNASVLCSQHIQIYHGFAEWPEFVNNCGQTKRSYLEKCQEAPNFGSTDTSETEKTFNEFDEDRRISCSAEGMPPPSLRWDDANMQYVNSEPDRLQVEETRMKNSRGVWTVLNTLTFAKVLRNDSRTFACHAENIAGKLNQLFIVRVMPQNSSSGTSWSSNIPSIIGGSIAIALLVPVGYLLLRRRQRNAALEKIYQQFKHGITGKELQSSSSPKSADEDDTSCLTDEVDAIYKRIQNLPFPKDLAISSSRLVIDESAKLGEGAFGIVYQGVLDKNTVVAIKTVRRGADNSKLTALLSEVKIMSFVGDHKNIVKLLGVQLARLKEGIVYVAVEYCPLGSLDDILTAKRHQLARAPNLNQLVYNVHGYLPQPIDESKPVAILELLGHCYQVCEAMEFLATKKIVHGDLASRNVLVGANSVCKISDFGLSRQIYDNYKKYVLAPKDTALPFRWLAIETLKRLKFSTESDIWAFGIFMWEVFSLAEIPYGEGVTWDSDFIKNMEDGVRLDIPEYATDQIHNLMSKCWHFEPMDRITFDQMSRELASIIETEQGIC